MGNIDPLVLEIFALAANLATICGVCVATAGVIVAIVGGGFAYNSWRRELSGAKNFELALKIYKLVYVLQDQLQELRTSIMEFNRELMPTEAEDYFSDKQNLRFEIAVLDKRFEKFRDTQLDLKTFGREAEILFDEETANTINWIQVDASIVAGMVHKYSRSIKQLYFVVPTAVLSEHIDEVWEDYKVAFYDPKTGEVYPPKLDASITKLEERLKRYLPHK